ncbi:MAG: serine hydrolase, partial [Bacteroidetes bacterium]|nr:serine hydrolase [Bacteroidota bacterium]
KPKTEPHSAYYIQKSREGVPEFLFSDTAWVDSLFNSLAPDERIGQLFMVAAYSNKDSAHVNQVESLIRKYKIGGLIFMQGGPARQAALTNYYQSISKTPLLIGMDAEWGLSMRLDSAIKFPYQMTLGAVQNRKLIYDMGAEIARQCKRMGVHINFAPVVDINSNPLNPVINYRSFGEDKFRVAGSGMAYMKGLQDNGVIATAKHFPGHGDTDTDSHLSLPVINRSRKQLDSLELYPFRELIKNRLAAVMVAHLNIPAFDTTKNFAATLSPKIVRGLLKDTLKFQGLTITDALNMKGVSRFYEPGVVDMKALLAGNDILLFSEDVGKAISEINKAVNGGLISRKEIDHRCRKILFAKRFAGLHKRKEIGTKGVAGDLNTSYSLYLNRKLYEEALTLLVNKNEFVPLIRLDTLKIATVAIGRQGLTNFQEMTDYYSSVKHFNLRRNPEKKDIQFITGKLPDYNTILLCWHPSGNKPENDYGITPPMVELLDTLLAMDSANGNRMKIILVVFGNPYGLSMIPKPEALDGIIAAYEDNIHTQQLSAQLVFGGIFSKGKATPGCQVLAARNGKVFYYRSFGNFTYDSSKAVTNTDMYDLASLTKITATLPAIMKLQDEKKLSVDSTLGTYLPLVRKSNKDTLKISEVLAHHARLKPWIPFYLRTMKKGKLSKKLYNEKPTKKYSIRVADSLYLHKSYRDSILSIIIESPLRSKREYYYSDLGFYLLKEAVEKISGEPIDGYVQNNFYRPLGMTTMGYLPLHRFPLSRIVPTENDTAFRNQLLQGDVHDPGAAMLGGVGGHAGIFACANDVAKLLQMYLQKGVYGGKRYINASTIEDFSRCRYCNEKNRRGLGFDKPEPDASKLSPACKSASLNSYGHAGFTGTYVWVDPDEQLVYVFLSNRVHPYASNNKLIEMNIRTEIQQVFYDAMGRGVVP